MDLRKYLANAQYLRVHLGGDIELYAEEILGFVYALIR
jgi:hypothetical protein